MRPDDRSHKVPAKKANHPHEQWPDPRAATKAPLAWTNKTMHHPATRIGEMRHGKSR